jgi:hypothetical protein
MTPKVHHETLSRLDSDGTPVTGVPLANTAKTVWLRTEDYTRIISTYGLSSWFLNSAGNGYAYVRLAHKGVNLMVARLVLGDCQRANVRHRDKDPLNLRLGNLYYGIGRGGDETTRKKRKSRLLSGDATVRADKPMSA